MIEKVVFKTHSNLINNANQVHEDVLKQESYTIKDNKIIKREILNSGLNVKEIPFELKSIKEVILANIEVQFALYQFYIMYRAVGNKAEHSQAQYGGELQIPNNNDPVNHQLICELLSIFDNIRVVYKKSTIHIQINMVRMDTKKKILGIYKTLYEESRLNSFILSFLSKDRYHLYESHSNMITYKYRPNRDQLMGIEVNEEELSFINSIYKHLTLAPYIMFYFVGWTEEEVRTSEELQKLAKHFNKIAFLSKEDQFVSQMLIIYN
ncbi:hypothetical protein PUW24_14750 [Paenibacillus urinalis]|uniref:Uncharacterized protein n=1 Tax=Paenibacillus urinalis TaxID=521520 RepID=A0ABY7XDJ6_9BACL|nr:hypothetical protein [Paenibacillus urinalis]WDH95475.1 hypothetical protein PUW24_14750 [Paenibacillus urinalis]WDI03673.1 hypothetical protein PUW25_06875 [Paenibacillus urinalis]